MKKTTLVVLAAGIGSRYGAGIKQLERVGCCGEIIIDFSIYDALKAGFNKVVFIIRKEIEEEFKSVIGDRISKLVEVEYVFQETADIPVPDNAGPAYIAAYKEKLGMRKKPWGTGHALWCCRNVVKEPFAVINADDYYGNSAFSKLHDYLAMESGRRNYCMAGFVLENTLSDNGTVTRGICSRSADDFLESCEETYSIVKKESLATGKNAEGVEREIALDSVTSMNMWGLTPDIFDILDSGLKNFLKEIAEADEKKLMGSEYLLPDIVGDLVKNREAKVKILDTEDRWFGITYEQDKAPVSRALKAITLSGLYPQPIFGGEDQ